MADLSKLRNKVKPVIIATGSTVLVTGLLTSCFITGNLIPPPVDAYVEMDWVSDDWSASDVQPVDAGPSVEDEGTATDEGPAVDEGASKGDDE
jgi:hypothetical protein